MCKNKQLVYICIYLCTIPTRKKCDAIIGRFSLVSSIICQRRLIACVTSEGKTNNNSTIIPHIKYPDLRY